MKKEKWREENYVFAVFVCENKEKACVYNTVKVDKGMIPKEMPCIGNDCNCKAFMRMPKDRPVPPIIKKPCLEWRKDKNSKTLLPWPLTSPEKEWLQHKEK